MAEISFVDRARLAWHVLTGSALKRQASVLFQPGLGGSYGEPPPAIVTATPLHYVQSEAVNAAVNAFANRISASTFALYQQNSEGDDEDVKDHPALGVLENPNPFLTRSELLWHVVSDLKLAGNAFWFLAGPSRRAPSEIWRCNPRQTRVVRDKATYISGYVTEIEGVTIPLDAAEVIHFKRPNPYDEWYGLPDLAAAAMAAQTGYEMEKWNRKTFSRDQAVPAGVVNVVDLVPDATFDQMKTQWRESYGGGERRTAFIRGGKVQFQAIGLSQKDVDFLAGSKWEAEKIYRVFGTYHLLPAQYADDRKVNERQFLEEHAWPLLRYIAEVITDQLLTFWGPRMGTGRYSLQFEDIRPRERALDLQEEQERAKGLTLNEWRAERGMDPLDGGDDILFVHAQQGQPVAFEVVTAPEPAPVTPPEAPPAEPAPEEPPPASNEDASDQAAEQESAGNEVGDEVGGFADKTAWHRELARWQRYALRHWAEADRRPFRVEQLPQGTAALIQAALDGCDQVAGIKAIFEDAHRLIDGEVTLKGSFGVPEGTVILKLSAVEDLLIYQQVLQRALPSHLAVRWTPVEQLHVTLVHTPLVDERPFRQVFEETAGSFEALPLQVTRLSTFPTEGSAPVPIVALVEPSEALVALQRELVDSFASYAIRVSAYSQPDQWTPHITLGYADADVAAAFPTVFTGDMDVRAIGDGLAFTRGDYVTEYAQSSQRITELFTIKAAGGPVYPAGPALQTTRIDFLKAIQATRVDFEMEFGQVLTAGRAGDIPRRHWAQRTRTLLRKYGERAYRDGLTDGGVITDLETPLDEDDQAELNRLLADQSPYVTHLGQVLFKGDGVTDTLADGKPELWFHKSVMPLYQAGRLAADKNGMYEWTLGLTEEHCTSCLEANGQRHRLKDWHRRGVIPQADLLECNGFNCDCHLVRTKERARGRLSAVPLHQEEAVPAGTVEA